MSIFRRDNDTPSPYEAVPARPAANKSSGQKQTPPVNSDSTYIARGSRVEGVVTGNSELVVDGNLDGEIALDSKVVVGADGVIRGEVNAISVEVAGRVIGNVRGSERVEVLASGTLEGDVVSPRIIISEGAFFKGKVEMTDPKPVPRPTPRVTPKDTGISSESPHQARPGGADGGKRQGPKTDGSGG